MLMEYASGGNSSMNHMQANCLVVMHVNSSALFSWMQRLNSIQKDYRVTAAVHQFLDSPPDPHVLVSACRPP
jgi:hypothetical protein